MCVLPLFMKLRGPCINALSCVAACFFLFLGSFTCGWHVSQDGTKLDCLIEMVYN